jgi:hypothetical protein
MNISTGIAHNAPQKVVIYGPEGFGKSSLAARFPRPFFVDTEGSTKHLAVDRVRVRSWSEVVSAVDHAIRQKYGTVVIDTIDWAETFLAEHIIAKERVPNLEKVGGGYGKGFVQLGEELSRFLRGPLDAAEEAGLHVVLISHSIPRKIEEPGQTAYDRFELDLNAKHCAPVVKQWADAVLFGNWDLRTSKIDGKAVARGGKERQMHTQHDPLWDAKNRHDLPSPLPWEWESIAHIIEPKQDAQRSAGIPAHPAPAVQGDTDVPSVMWSDVLANFFASEAEAKCITEFFVFKGYLASGRPLHEAQPDKLKWMIDHPSALRNKALQWEANMHTCEKLAGKEAA